MTLTKPVVVPFEGPLTKGNFVRRTDRFTAHLVLDGIEVTDESSGEVKPIASTRAAWRLLSTRGPRSGLEELQKTVPSAKTDWTWELIERGYLCSTNTQRPNTLMTAVLRAKSTHRVHGLQVRQGGARAAARRPGHQI